MAEPKANILLVDDAPDGLIALEAGLADLGQNLVKARSGKEALKWLLKNECAVILLDVRMPVMDGFETAALIREREKSRRTPIIFITGISTKETHLSQAYSLGAVDYLFKPIAPQLVRSKVEAFVALFNEKRELERETEKLANERRELAEFVEAIRSGQVDTIVGGRGESKILRLLDASIVERNERLLRELSRSNTELDQFAHVASHDLQEPVRKLIAFSSLLAKDLGEDLPEQAARYLGFIEDAARRMQTLVNDLLTLSRAGRATPNYEHVPLDRCVDRALEALATRVEETSAEVARDELPTVVGDASMLTQLYQNLIGNALKFVVADQLPAIRLTAERTSGEWVFGVRDNGIGLKPEYAEQIFVAFKRLHGRSEYEGSGIGLAICRKTVERHGGRIWVESEPGQGAHFKFTISSSLEAGECQSKTAKQPAFC